MMEVLVTAAIGMVLLTAVAVMLLLRKKASSKNLERLRLAVAEGQLVPLSLHPVIDPTMCVGSFSCIKACPEGEIIGIVDGVATLVEAAHCIGHGTCAVECPVGAIKLVFGTAERGIDLPQLAPSFESSRAGVFIIGELGGMGLIKNAFRQGLVLGKTLGSKLKHSQASDDFTDVVVIGGGPAGIACAIACKQEGLDVRLLEQDTLGGTVAHYPRGKVVMSEQIVMPGYGPFGRSLISKEELVEDMRALLAKNQVVIEEGQRVVAVTGQEPLLSVTTSTEQTVRCRAVVLAIGLRGTPQTLGVPGEDLPKVMYRLVDPEQYHGQRVLVVGGGDSAVEAAIQLAEESTATVTISYRQVSFTRCKQRNREKIARLIEEGRVKALFQTKVSSITAGIVRLASALEVAADKAGTAAPASERAKPLVERLPPAIQVSGAPPVAPEDIDTGGVTEFRPEFHSIQEAVSVAEPFGPVSDGSPAQVVWTVGDTRAKPPPAADNVTGRFRAVPLPTTGVRPSSAAPVGRVEELADALSDKTVASDRASLFAQLTPQRPLTVLGSVGAVALDSAGAPAPAKRSTASGSQTADATVFDVSLVAEMLLADLNKKSADTTALKNDSVIISIGGQLPTQFLSSIGVRTRVYRGEEKTGMGALPGTGGKTKAQVEGRARRRLALTLWCLGAGIIACLMLVGKEYYWLSLEERASSPLHAMLKPSGVWGHGVGVVASLFMVGNFLYALRKRWRRLKGGASIRTWLTLHMFIGIMGPLVIAFHAAFLVNNLLAVYTWGALSVVVATGIFGRFLFGFVPAQAGKMLGVSELREQVSDMTRTLQPHMAASSDLGSVTRIFAMATEAPVERTMIGAVVRDVKARKSIDRQLDEARVLFKEQAKFEIYKESVHKISRMKMQISFHAALKRLFRAWLVVHVVVAVFMVALISAHVAVTTYLGFHWIFTAGGT